MDEQKLIDAAAQVGVRKRSTEKYHRDQYEYVKPKKIDLDEHYLYVEWCSGGISGGSCWDDGTDDRHYGRSGEAEPEFDNIDTVLAELCPNLTFLQYKKIMAKIVKRGEYTINEYYGNTTDYTFKVVNLRELYEALQEMKL